MRVKRVIKRAGYTERYDKEKLLRSIKSAFESSGVSITDEDLASFHRRIAFRLDKEEITADDIEAAIIAVIGVEYPEVVKNYVLYTDQKRKRRAEKLQLLSPYYDELTGELKDRQFLSKVEKEASLNAVRLFTVRYLWKKSINGKVAFIETIDDLFKRVAVNGLLPHLIHEIAVEKNVPMEEISYVDSIIDEESVWDWVSGFKRLSSYFNMDKEKYRYIFRLPGNGEFFLTKYHVERLWVLAHRFRVGDLTGPDLFKEAFLRLHRGEAEEFFYWLEKTYDALLERRFLPNTPALVNAGRPLGQNSACFALGYVPDDMSRIMDYAKDIALISKSGGGIGINLSQLRPKGDTVKTTMGAASGPISFLELYDKVLSVVSQGGVRRGAGMAIMEYWHPQIMDFVKAKEKNTGQTYLSTFNLSVGTDEEFWEKVFHDEEIDLINPRNNEVVGKMRARELLDKVAEYAWAKGDPAFLYFHNHNNYANALVNARGPIKSTNPCGEEQLYPYTSCNLASIDIAKHLKNEGDQTVIDWEKLQETIEITYNYLDNINDVNKFPLDKIALETRKLRNVGLGIMGLARTAMLMKLPYNSDKFFKTMSKIAEFITWHTIYYSTEKAQEWYSFSEFEQSKYKDGFLPVAALYQTDLIPDDEITLDWNYLSEKVKKGIRNFDLTTVPPTGSVSMLAETSSGVEPEFALVYIKDTTAGVYYYFNPVFEKWLRQYLDEIDIKKFADSIKEHGGLKHAEKPEQIPEEDWEWAKRVFITAREMSPEDHIILEWVIARWITNAVSKTINLPHNISVSEVKSAFVLAERLKLKGITVYRDGSLLSQVYKTNSMEFWIEPYSPTAYTNNIINKLLEQQPFLKDLISEPVTTQPEKEEETTEMFLNIGISGNLPASEEVNDKERVYCPECGAKLIRKDGCVTCPICGWSACTNS